MLAAQSSPFSSEHAGSTTFCVSPTTHGLHSHHGTVETVDKDKMLLAARPLHAAVMLPLAQTLPLFCS